MDEALLEYLACPACGSEQLALNATERDGRKIQSGALSCVGCKRDYPIRDGIPRLLPEADRYFAPPTGGERPSAPSPKDPLADALTLTIEHYSSYQGKVYADLADRLDNQAILEARTGLALGDFSGKVCLDAGCGVGRMARLLSTAGARTSIGMDAGWAVDEARRRSPDAPNLHWIQGDILRPPLRKGVFDRILCLGVLHHTREPDRGFRALAARLKSGGSLSLYLYFRDYPSYRYSMSFRGLLRQARHVCFVEPLRKAVVRLPDRARKAFCWMLWQRRRCIESVRRLGAPGARLAKLLEFASPPDPYKPLENAHSNIARSYDMYSTPFNFHHDLGEVIDWFERERDFDEIWVTPYRLGVTANKGIRAADQPLRIHYHPRRSMEEIESRGIAGK